jgi:hypothetical protein
VTHTPGPWTLEQDINAQWNVYAGDEWIALIPHQCVAAIEKQRAVDAILIAAAPDLLAALKALREHDTIRGELCDYVECGCETSQLLAQVDAAIRKAEGRS